MKSTTKVPLYDYLLRGGKNTVVFTATALISRLLSMVALPFVLRVLSPADVGIWDLCQTAFSLSTLLLSSVTATSITRFITLYEHDAQKQKAVVGNAFVSWAAVSCCVLVAYACAYACHTIPTVYVPFASAIVINSMLYALFSLVLAYYKIHERRGLYALLYITQQLIATIGTVFAAAHHFCLPTFLYATTLSLLCVAPAGGWLAYHHRAFSLSLLRNQLTYALPLLVYSVMYGFFLHADRYIIAQHLGMEAVGTYGILWRFGALFQFFSIALLDALPLVIYKAYNAQDRTLVHTLMQYASIAIGVAATSMPFAVLIGVRLFLPDWCMHAVTVGPLFFGYLLMFETARMCQIGFHLIQKTHHELVLAAIFLCVQTVLIYVGVTHALAGICIANACVFSAYALSTVVWIRYIAGAVILPIAYTGIYLLSVSSIIVLQWHCFLQQQLSIALGIHCTYWAIVVWHYCVPFTWKQWCMHAAERLIQRMVFKKHIHTVHEYTMREHTYSNALHNQTILIASPLPPPLGGVAVHAQRLRATLEIQDNCVETFDTTQTGIRAATQLCSLLLRIKPDTVIYHTIFLTNGIRNLFLLYCLKLFIRYQLMVVDHDPRHITHKSILMQQWMSMLFRRVDQVILIGDATRNSYAQTTIMLPKQVTVESSFLPPDIRNETCLLAHYPTQVHAFMQAHKPLIIANAFQPTRINNMDLYGIDTMIRLLARLKMHYESVGLLVLLAQIHDTAYFHELQQLAAEQECDDSILFLTGNYELWPLLKRAHLFVRPTRSDSYGISVAEARYFNVPAIASEVCARAAGTHVYPVHDEEALYALAYRVLASHIVQISGLQQSAPCPSIQLLRNHSG
ncbi:MAG: oligosaccharide flippase family protein [Candidatus Babeliales bacterium]